MILITEEWENGALKSQRIDEGNLDEKALRNAIDGAITDLQVIQGAALTTEAAQINAIKKEAEILEKVLRFIKRRV